MDGMRNVLVPKEAQEYGDGVRVERHRPALLRRIRYARRLLALHLELQEGDDSVQEIGAMGSDIVGKPLIQVEILASRSQRRNIQGELEWSDLKQSIQDLLHVS